MEDKCSRLTNETGGSDDTNTSRVGAGSPEISGFPQKGDSKAPDSHHIVDILVAHLMEFRWADRIDLKVTKFFEEEYMNLPDRY